eukprot:gene64444-88131_t
MSPSASRKNQNGKNDEAGRGRRVSAVGRAVRRRRWSVMRRRRDDGRRRYDRRLFFHMLFELIWQYRFLYRDLNDLLSKNRRIETHFQYVLKEKTQAVQRVLAGLARGNAVRLSAPEAESVATAMVVVSTYWLSYEYVRDPRHALEPENAGA